MSFPLLALEPITLCKTSELGVGPRKEKEAGQERRHK